MATKFGIKSPTFLTPIEQFQGFLKYNEWLKGNVQEFVISNYERDAQWAKMLTVPADALLFYCHNGDVVKTAELAWEYTCSYRDKIWKSDYVRFENGYMKPADNEPLRPSGFYIRKRPVEDKNAIGRKFQNTRVVDVRKQLGNDYGMGCEGIQFVGITHKHYPELINGNEFPFINLPGLAISPSADGRFHYASSLDFYDGKLVLDDAPVGYPHSYGGSGSLQQY